MPIAGSIRFKDAIHHLDIELEHAVVSTEPLTSVKFKLKFS